MQCPQISSFLRQSLRSSACVNSQIKSPSASLASSRRSNARNPSHRLLELWNFSLEFTMTKATSPNHYSAYLSSLKFGCKQIKKLLVCSLCKVCCTRTALGFEGLCYLFCKRKFFVRVAFFFCCRRRIRRDDSGILGYRWDGQMFCVRQVFSRVVCHGFRTWKAQDITYVVLPHALRACERTVSTLPC